MKYFKYIFVLAILLGQYNFLKLQGITPCASIKGTRFGLQTDYHVCKIGEINMKGDVTASSSLRTNSKLEL